jgi:hypothetical protein
LYELTLIVSLRSSWTVAPEEEEEVYMNIARNQINNKAIDITRPVCNESFEQDLKFKCLGTTQTNTN